MAAFLSALFYAYPGYMNYDSSAQLAQARARIYDDWHPPVLARYWHFADLVVRGPFVLLIVQVGLFAWGINGLFLERFGERRSAISAALVLMFPPIVVVMAVVWKDAQMAGWMFAGFCLILRPTRSLKWLGLGCLCVAVAMRYNACAALLPIACVAMLRRHGITLRGAAASVGLFAFITVVAFGLNRIATTRNAHSWTASNAIHDIAGTLCNARPLSDVEIRGELTGVRLQQQRDLQKHLCDEYDPRWWLALSNEANGMFDPRPDESERAARSEAYIRVVRNHPRAFALHRWRVFAALIGLDGGVPDEPVCQTFAGTPAQSAKLRLARELTNFQSIVGDWIRRLAGTALFLPWVYLVLAAAFLAFAVALRDGLIVALLSSGILYECSYFLGAAGAPFRYSHYMIVCVVVAAMLIAQRSSAQQVAPS